MSTVRTLKTWINPEDYLRAELANEVRREYFAGEVVAMAGASDNHNYIAGNIFAELHLHLRGQSCAPFMNNMKVHIHSEGDDWYYYPDVMVNCDPAGQKRYYCDTPSIIFEVLSPETEATDRREKRLAYAKIPSLHTYVLLAQDGARSSSSVAPPRNGLAKSCAIYARTGL